MNEYSVIAENLCKRYKIYKNPKDKIKDLLLPKEYGKDFYALKNISFKVQKGDVVGLLGLNGSGKSTLSNIIGGISMPTSGNIDIVGEPSIIAISSGLNGQLTGIENIELKGLMLGFTKSKINKIMKEIIDFADIGEFINQPVKTYSSGMKARLGFAISINIDPDVLVIDEALAVGDATFTERCLEKMREFKENGKTIFFVSHALPQIREFCTKAMWIEYGVLKLYGEINEVADQYQKFLNEYNKMTKKQRLEYRRAAVENQNHLLLNSTENSAKTYKIKLSGKIIKYVSVKKKNHIKKIPYNFDWHMLIFSVFTAIVREDIKALFICIGIITGALLIFQNSLIGYFSLMLIFSLVSGRMYVKDLLYARGYIPVKNVKKRNEEDIEDINTGDNNIEDQKRQD